MKKIFTLLFCGLALLGFKKAGAQSFSVQHDTVTATFTPGSAGVNLVDGVNNLGAGSITVTWKVIASDFPSDWVPGIGICDNNLCYTLSSLVGGTSHVSNAYGPGLGDFHMQINLAGTTPGCYYVKVRLNNTSVATDTAIETFILCRGTPTGTTTVIRSTDEVTIYPNPATDELNVIYDPSADIKNIAIYNIIGKVMNVYKVTDNSSANLSIGNMPSGIYFVRLINSNGQVVTTKKFTKQ